MHRALRLEILKNFDTQADFAAAVGEHDSKVSMVLRGRRKLSSKQAKRWIKVLKCGSDMLIPVLRGQS